MKVLVTGSHGFIGRALVERLEREGYALRTFDRPASAVAGREHFPGDLRDVFAVRQAVQGVEMVLHLGALASDYRHAEEVLEVNVQGTWNVLQACVECGVQRVVYFSSINALGCVGGHRPPEYLPLDDFHPRHPMTPYQLSKHLGEEVCRSYSERYGIVTLCLRPTYVVDTTNPPWWWRRASPERYVEWAKDELWAYVDLQDVCDAVLQAMRVEGVLHDAFLLSAADTFANVPSMELVERFWSHLPWKGDQEAYFAQNPYRALVDTTHAAQVLGWQPKRSWRDSVSQGGEAR